MKHDFSVEGVSEGRGCVEGVPLPLGEGLWLPRSWGGERIDFAQHLCSWCGAQVNSKLMDFPDMCNSAAVANDSEHRKKCKGREKGRGKRGRGGEGGLQCKQETTRMRCRLQIQARVSGHHGKCVCPGHSSGKTAYPRQP